jgi:hypothetical protein
MSAPKLTLRTSGITWRTGGYGGTDNDMRLIALGELCVDVQRLARSTLVKISASDSPASSSASAARNRFRDSGGTPPETFVSEPSQIPAIALGDTLNGLLSGRAAVRREFLCTRSVTGVPTKAGNDQNDRA